MVSHERGSGVAHINQIAHSDTVNLKRIIIENYFHLFVSSHIVPHIVWLWDEMVFTTVRQRFIMVIISSITTLFTISCILYTLSLKHCLYSN